MYELYPVKTCWNLFGSKIFFGQSGSAQQPKRSKRREHIGQKVAHGMDHDDHREVASACPKDA